MLACNLLLPGDFFIWACPRPHPGILPGLEVALRRGGAGVRLSAIMGPP